jgi:hypothetical protein
MHSAAAFYENFKYILKACAVWSEFVVLLR